MGRLFNPRFPGLMSDTVTLPHSTVIGIVVLTDLHLHHRRRHPHCKFKIGA
jgi:hypothetical protein